MTNDDGEVRELISEDFAGMVPFAELPQELQNLLASPKRVQQDDEPQPTRHPAA